MELYLLKWKKQVIGYTYDEIAIITMKTILREANEEDIIVDAIGLDEAPVVEGIVFKTKDHLDNLSKWYSRVMGYEFVSWKLIDFNRKVINRFNYDFYSKFEKLYKQIKFENELSELNADLDDLLK